MSVESRRLILERLGHEVLNPLNSISGISELLLQRKEFSAVNRAHALALRDASESLLSVAHNVGLSLGAPPLAMLSALDVKEILEEVVMRRLSRAVAKRLHFETHIEPDAPSLVEADAKLLRDLLANIIDHCLAITSHGHVEITLHADPAEVVSITISDTGPSFSPETLSHLFEPFGLTGRARDTNLSGTGLNLHVAHLLAQSMSGELTCSARSSAGTVFALRFPATIHSRFSGAVDVRNVIPHNDHYARHRTQIPPKHLLIAEDQLSNAHIIASTLERGGHSVVIAYDGDQALEHIGSNEHFDAVVVDLRLPGISGLDVMKLSRFRVTGRKHDIPFIVLTGETSEKTRQDCFTAGAWTFLQKPVSSQHLLDAVALVCERADRLAEADPISQREISVGAAHKAILNGDPSQTVFDNFRDVLGYIREIEARAAEHNWRTVLHRTRAVRGAAFLIGASRVVAVCRRILHTPSDELAKAWPALQRDLGDSVEDAWCTLSKLLNHPLDEV